MKDIKDMLCKDTWLKTQKENKDVREIIDPDPFKYLLMKLLPTMKKFFRFIEYIDKTLIFKNMFFTLFQ